MASRASWRRNQFAVTAASFVGFTGFTLVMPFLPLYIHQLGVSDVARIALWSGLSLGVTPAVTAVLSPFWGRVADRVGRKLMVERSLVSFVIIMAATAYVTEAWHVFALRAIQGLFAGYGGLTLAMAAESAPRDRMAMAIGWVQTAQRVGPALGPVIGGVVAALVGLRHAFLVAAFLYLIAFVLVLALYRDPQKVPPPEGGRRPERLDVRALLGTPGFLLMMAAIFVVTFVDRSFGPILPLYVQRLGVPADRVALVSGLLFTAAALGAAVGNQACDRLLRRTSAVAAVAGGALLASSALTAFLLMADPVALGIALVVFGVGVGVALTTAYTVGGHGVPAEAHATGFGFLTGAALAGLALSPVLSGLLTGHSLLSVFGLDLGLLALVAAAVYRWMPRGPDAPEAGTCVSAPDSI